MTNIEAFIFCYAGEYLSNKVGDNYNNLKILYKIMIKFKKLRHVCKIFLHLYFYQSKSIGLAAYNIAWYELEPEYSRILLFIILRAQKQLTLTVGKMTDLSLRCFASVRFFTYYYLYEIKIYNLCIYITYILIIHLDDNIYYHIISIYIFSKFIFIYLFIILFIMSI